MEGSRCEEVWDNLNRMSFYWGREGIAGFHFCFSEKLNLDAFSFVFKSSFYGILVKLCQVSFFGYISRHNRHFS